jgi:hypothetical protein
MKIRLKENNIPRSLTIFSQDGKTVYSEENLAGYAEEELTVDISGLPFSLYFLRVETSAGYEVIKFAKVN